MSEQQQTWYVCAQDLEAIEKYAAEVAGDEETQERPRLTWRERRQLNKELKREERALRRGQKYAHKSFMKRLRKDERDAKLLNKVEAKARRAAMKNPTLQTAFKTFVEIAEGRAKMPDHHLQARINAANAIRTGFTEKMNRRFRFVAMVGTWLTAFCIAMLVTCSACAHNNPPLPVTAGVAQDTNAVMVMKWCLNVNELVANPEAKPSPSGIGSGVLVAPDIVLTAKHVVDCTDTAHPEQINIPVPIVTTSDNRSYGVEGIAELGHDVVAVKLTMPIKGTFKPIKFGMKPPTGEAACMSSMHPEYQELCGVVQGYRETPSGDMRISIPAVPGNSGSGVYNRKHELIGITVQRLPCADSLPLFLSSCAGFATSMQEVLK